MMKNFVSGLIKEMGGVEDNILSLLKTNMIEQQLLTMCMGQEINKEIKKRKKKKQLSEQIFQDGRTNE